MALEIFKLIGSVFVDTEAANKSLSSTDSKAQSLGQTFLAGVGHAAAWGAATVAAAATAGAKFVSMAADAETAFAKVQTLLSTDTDMTAYYNDIMEASNNTGVAFEDFSEAVYSAISASVDAADAVDFTTEAIKLAKGGFTDTSTAVDVLTTAINAYGMSADDASHISDVLIGTQNAGKTTVDELASSMGKVIPIANANNVTLEEMSAMYAVVTKNGTATAEAGTGIKAMLSELGKSGSTADKALRALTASTYGQEMGFADLQAEGFGTDEVLAMLQTSAEESGKSLQDMFGSVEAGNIALTLMKDGGQELADLNYELSTSSGAATEAFDTMGQTFEEKLTILQNNLANVSIALGEELMPIAEQIMDWVTEHLPEIQTAIETAFALIGQGVTEAGNILTWAFGIVESYMPQIQELISQVASAVEWVSGIFGQHMPAIEGFVSTAVSGISGFVQTELMPIFEKLITFIQDVLAPAFEAVFQYVILPVVQICFDGIKELWEVGLKPILNGIIDFLTGVFTGNWELAFQGLSDIVSGIFNGLVAIIKVPLNTIITGLNTFIGGLNTIQIPDWVPGVGGMGLNIPEIPYLAKGGVLEKGQTGFLEGTGSEAVVPLENNSKWISAVAADMNTALGGNKTAELLASILDKVETLTKSGIYLDTGAMVGSLAGPMDKKLGLIYAQKARA